MSMTPERKEEIKKRAAEYVMSPSQHVIDLLTVLEEAQQQREKAWNGEMKWREVSVDAHSKLAEAQQTIAHAIQIYETADMETDFDNVLTGMYEALKGIGEGAKES